MCLRLLAAFSFLFLSSQVYADLRGLYSTSAAAWSACTTAAQNDCTTFGDSQTITYNGASCVVGGRYQYVFDQRFYYCAGEVPPTCASGAWDDATQQCLVPPDPCASTSGVSKTFSSTGGPISATFPPPSVCDGSCSYGDFGGPTSIFNNPDGTITIYSQRPGLGTSCSGVTSGSSDVTASWAAAVPVVGEIYTGADGTQTNTYSPPSGLSFSCRMVNGIANCESSTGVICLGTECRQLSGAVSTSYNAVSTSTKTNTDGTSETTILEYSVSSGAARTTTITKDASGNPVGSPVITDTTSLNNPAVPSSDGTVSTAPKGVDVPTGELSNSDVDVSSSGFTETSYVSFGTPACPAPVSFTVKGQQVSFSFDRICDGLAMFGILLVAVGAFIGVRIFLSMFPSSVGAS